MPRSSTRWRRSSGARRIPPRPCVWTIGHSNRPIAVFLDLLQARAIALLVDIRSWPGSRRHPQFAREALARSLAEAGIAYHHCPALGGRRPRPSHGRPSPNGFWRIEGFRNYADYALTPPFAEALRRLLAEAERRRTAIMCAEALPANCHRRIVTDHLLARGAEVRHILDRNRIETARMTDAARISPDGVVTYPSPQPGLFDDR